MTTELATINTPKFSPPAVTHPQRVSALSVMAAKFNVEPTKLLDTLKQTVFKNASEAQLMALCIVANEYGLNPFVKQIYAFPDKSGGIVPVVGVDGWIHLMNSNPQFNGIEFEMTERDGNLVACTATIYRKDRSRPVRATEFLAECSRNTDPWRTCPRRMLRHKAMIQAVRLAFGFSGIYDEDEAEIRTVSATVVERPTFIPAEKPAQLPHAQPEPAPAAKAPEPAPAQGPAPKPRRMTKLPGGQTVAPPAAPAAPTPAPAANAQQPELPGPEPELPGPEPAKAAETMHDQLRAQHPTATDADFLAMFRQFRMDGGALTFDDVPADQVSAAVGDRITAQDTLEPIIAARTAK